MKRRVSPVQQLRALYDQIPGMVDCKGLCHTSCGPVPVSRVEQRQMRRWHGRTLPLWPTAGTTNCPLLSEELRCTVYADRPMLCRLWGAAEGLPCTHGCEPAGPPVTDSDARRLLAEAEQIEP